MNWSDCNGLDDSDADAVAAWAPPAVGLLVPVLIIATNFLLDAK
jgi:hypothetical protein